MSLEPPEKVRSLQRKLYEKAKREPELPLLPALRQGVPRGHPRIRLEAVPCERWSAGRGRGEIRGHRGAGRGGVARRARKGAAREDVPSKPGTPGDDSEAGRRRAATGHPDDTGPSGADRRQACAGADLRGGPRAEVRMDIGRGRVPTTRCEQCTAACARGTETSSMQTSRSTSTRFHTESCMGVGSKTGLGSAGC